MPIQYDDPQAFPPGGYWLIRPTSTRGGLLGMPFPKPERRVLLPKIGVGLIVSLVESRLMENYLIPLELRLAHLAITDGKPPVDTQLPVVAKLCLYMHHFRQQGPEHSVAVHCQGGQGRTGLLLTCYRALVQVRYPADPDGAEVQETLRAIDAHLLHAQGPIAHGPADQQPRWANWFTAQLQQHISPTYLVTEN